MRGHYAGPRFSAIIVRKLHRSTDGSCLLIRKDKVMMQRSPLKRDRIWWESGFKSYLI